VVSEDLRPCGLGGAIKRNILYFVDSLGIFIGVLGYVVVATASVILRAL
jgi:hypothetical protein